jgi:thiol-disulfide isomerase/thioredoxin
MKNITISEIHAWAKMADCSLDRISEGSGIKIGILMNIASFLDGNETIDFENFRTAWEAEKKSQAKPSELEPSFFDGEPPVSTPPNQDGSPEETAPEGATPGTGDLVADRVHTPPPVPTEDDLPQEGEAAHSTAAAGPAAQATKQGRANRKNKTAKADSQSPRSKNATRPAADPVVHEEDAFDRVEAAIRIRELGSVAGRNNLEVGRLSLVAKANLPHGQFGKFVESETRMSRTYVGNCMRVAELIGDRKISDSEKLPWEALTLLARAKLDGPGRVELLNLLLGDDCPPLKEFREILENVKSAYGANTVVNTVPRENEEAKQRFDSLLEHALRDALLEAAKALGPRAATERFKAKLITAAADQAA